jgi:hypothetical protein
MEGRLSLFFTVWVLMFIGSVLDGQLLYGGGDFWSFTSTRGAWIETIMLFSMWCVVVTGRAHFEGKAWRSIHEDMNAYLHEWHLLLNDPSTESVLKEIDERCCTRDGQQRVLKANIVAHTVSSPGVLSPQSITLWNIFSANDRKVLTRERARADVHLKPVTFLDQLYLQVFPALLSFSFALWMCCVCVCV